jgi:uncharacterized protein (DUF1800 family)
MTMHSLLQWMVRGALLMLLSACAAPHPNLSLEARSAPIKVIERLSWGVDAASVRQVSLLGIERYVDLQLQPSSAVLPVSVQAQLDAMTIAQQPLEKLVLDLEQRRKDADAIADGDQKKAARRALQHELDLLAREAATRSLLRDLYSPAQLQEHMVWFWVNHFSVDQGKHNLRAMVGDYEETAIRPHVLGKFRDLLAATVHHPAMLRYLDNEQNAVGHINENYARELIELHTLGVNGGYAQRDVQELARILTGFGVNLGTARPRIKPELQAQYVRQGLFEFNPERHDYGDKQFLGRAVRGQGLAELDEVVDRLSRHPATAHFVSRKLAVFFVADQPSNALVEQMAATFLRTDGDIAATLRTMLGSVEFAQSLGHKFKDPVHYVVSALRLAYDDKPIMNAAPVLGWLSRMGQPLYGRRTPDGYAMTEAQWSGSGQMTTRFDIARAVGQSSAGLFKTAGAQPVVRPAFPQLSNALYFQHLQAGLSAATRQSLEQATSQAEWNAFLLSAPETMRR